MNIIKLINKYYYVKPDSVFSEKVKLKEIIDSVIKDVPVKVRDLIGANFIEFDVYFDIEKEL